MARDSLCNIDCLALRQFSCSFQTRQGVSRHSSMNPCHPYHVFAALMDCKTYTCSSTACERARSNTSVNCLSKLLRPWKTTRNAPYASTVILRWASGIHLRIRQQMLMLVGCIFLCTESSWITLSISNVLTAVRLSLKRKSRLGSRHYERGVRFLPRAAFIVATS